MKLFDFLSTWDVNQKISILYGPDSEYDWSGVLRDLPFAYLRCFILGTNYISVDGILLIHVAGEVPQHG